MRFFEDKLLSNVELSPKNLQTEEISVHTVANKNLVYFGITWCNLP